VRDGIEYNERYRNLLMRQMVQMLLRVREDDLHGDNTTFDVVCKCLSFATCVEAVDGVGLETWRTRLCGIPSCFSRLKAGVGHHDLSDGGDGLEGGDMAVSADGSGGAARRDAFAVD
jgi:hypothetical protein